MVNSSLGRPGRYGHLANLDCKISHLSHRVHQGLRMRAHNGRTDDMHADKSTTSRATKLFGARHVPVGRGAQKKCTRLWVGICDLEISDGYRKCLSPQLGLRRNRLPCNCFVVPCMLCRTLNNLLRISMSRVPGMTTLASGWRQCALYGVAMSALSLSAMGAGYALSESIWKASVENSADQQRTLSRVEKYFAAKANAAVRAEPGPYRPVVALQRPDIHPAALAAAMDRTELTSAIEYPEHHPVAVADMKSATTVDIASWRAPAAAVAGIACSATECHDSGLSQAAAEEADADQQQTAEVAALEVDAAEIVIATSSADSETFATEPLVKPLPKPYKLGKGRLSARQKPSRKVLTQYADEQAIVKFFVGPGATSLRVADTPSDIISRTLRGTI